jgi:hypothetical protein
MDPGQLPGAENRIEKDREEIEDEIEIFIPCTNAPFFLKPDHESDRC